MRLRVTWRGAIAGLLLVVAATARALSMSPTLLPVSDDILTLGEWNSNFNGARAVADRYRVPLLVFYGGLSCGKCEELQRACLTDEFLAWQREHKMLMVFTTNNSHGDASGFAKPQESSGFPFIAVYWNRDGQAPQKDTELYRRFNGRDGEMLVKDGTLAGQLIGSIEAVAGAYDFSSLPDISGRAEELYSEPVTTKTHYDIRLFAGFDVSSAWAPQKVYNVVGSAKPKLKKISGTLPKGIRLALVDGALVLSGKAKKAGAYRYEFSIQQRRNDVLHAGPPIVLAFDVIAVNDASQGGCAMLGRALKATVPLFADETAGKAMKGVIELSTTARNRIKARYMGLSGRKPTFIGEWTDIVDGTAKASLAASGKKLVLEMGGNGALRAVLSDPDLSAPLTSLDGLKVGPGTFAAAFAGSFTASLAETSAESGTGCGYLFIKKVLPSGKVQWGGMLGNGRTISGTAFAMTDAKGRGAVAVFKYTAKDYVAAALTIRPNSSEPTVQRAVVACEGTVPRWAHVVAPVSVHDCEVRGSRWSKGLALDECCLAQFFETALELSAVTDGFTSEVMGPVTSAPSVGVQVTADTIKLAGKSSDVKLSFSKAKGVFKGSMKVTFASGAKTVKFAGVAIPGWHDCGCAPIDASDPFHVDVSRPFAVGAAWFADRTGGAAATRGFTVKIDEKVQ
ncbi:MAG: hypothetical protein IJL17_06035 [Kiritimatiellae bacterium]|nr:hypothetical protein [Kiritimatiellia bacterium]